MWQIWGPVILIFQSCLSDFGLWYSASPIEQSYNFVFCFIYLLLLLLLLLNNPPLSFLALIGEKLHVTGEQGTGFCLFGKVGNHLPFLLAFLAEFIKADV